MARETSEPTLAQGSGILSMRKGGAGVLVDATGSPGLGSVTIQVSARLIRDYDLPPGASVAGPVEAGRQGPVLSSVSSVCGLAPEAFASRTRFERLVAIDPDDRFRLGDTGELGMRLVDLIAPIGKGTRGLIVSPPKAGKTMLLEQLASAIHATGPGTRIIVLLIDERPEEVTYFRRHVEAEVFASSADQGLRQHVELAELMMAHIRTELECGRDVVVLLDSLTRLSRTFNLRGGPRGGRGSLSGGLDPSALEIPRRFFGQARNVEGGGSVTILATILIDTGSRMDQMIFEEFKGTGNSEIVLDRSLADARMFPAIDLIASGTRKEHLLFGPEDTRRIGKLRRLLAGRQPKDAWESLVQLLERYPSNQAFLESIHL